MNKSVQLLVRAAVLLALALVFQMGGFPQPVTGPAVNAVLALAALSVGIYWGSAIGLLTPWVAFARGILPPPLAPAIPFIMLGNALLVIIFGLLAPRNKYVAGILAAVAKFALLFVATRYLIAVPPKVAAMLQVPQLYTALAGIALAIIIQSLLPPSLFMEGKKL